MKGPDFHRLAILMGRALEGDSCAYESALVAMGGIVRAFARARLGETLADDVVQETLISVHQARHTYDPRRPFGPWLMSIAHSRVIDAARRQRRRALNEAPQDGEPVGRPQHRADRSLIVAQALQQLPPRQRRVIELLKLEGRSVKEVALRLGLSISNVKVIAHRGYEALRRTLRDES